ncbi:hypothetical protein GE061_018882 [Apolygus lucorum]|uniref:Ionotropic glutamate receptor C-terminal domain-containing protein n=1 Tax=Apolygus lucorum TaxID=248454 RepID=A0A8S9X8T6_APOLU|nr:hypothetical protein GE061_018882 [Apolygus lucorum]
MMVSSGGIICLEKLGNKDIRRQVSNPGDWWGDSEVLLTFLGTPSRHFIRRQPYEYFHDLTDIQGIWEIEPSGVRNFNGRTIKVGTFNCTVFSSFEGLDELGQPTRFGGMELILVKESFDRLNLKLNIVMPTTSDLWGQFDGERWQDGIMGLLMAREVDLAFCGLWIVSSMTKCKLETSFPVAEGCLKLIVPKPQYLNSGWFSLFNPFKIDMWVFTGISVITAALLLFCSSYFIRLYRPAERFRSGVTLVGCIFWAISLFLAAGNGDSSNEPIRQIVIWWITLGFILTTCYSSGLITQLTSPTLSTKMETIQQLVENDFVWTSPYALDLDLMLDFNDTWESTWAKRMRIIPDQQNEWKTVASSKVALFGQQYGKESFTLDSEYPQDLLKKFEITRNCINTYRIGLVFRAGSPYFRPMENLILRFHSGGLIDKMMNDEFEKVAMLKPYVREVFNTRKKMVKSEEKLKMDNLKGAFLLLVVGLMGALIVFLLELLVQAYKS